MATIHPDNRFSAGNFEKNGFKLATPEPIPKYGSRRNIYARPLSRKDAKKTADGTYTVYPYV